MKKRYKLLLVNVLVAFAFSSAHLMAAEQPGTFTDASFGNGNLFPKNKLDTAVNGGDYEGAFPFKTGIPNFKHEKKGVPAAKEPLYTITESILQNA